MEVILIWEVTRRATNSRRFASPIAGNESHANHTLPGLVKLLDSLPESKRPMLVRGDAGLAGEPLLYALEERGQNYLFTLRLTTNVKRYIEKLFWEKDWKRAGQGWEGKDGELRLEGWSCLGGWWCCVGR